MSEGMIGLVPLDEIRGVAKDLFEKLTGREGPTFAAELKKFVLKEPCWVPVELVEQPVPTVPVVPRKLLAPVATLDVPAFDNFVVAEHVIQDTSRKARVKIRYIGENFRRVFLPMTETGVPAANLQMGNLLEQANSTTIRETLPKGHEGYVAWLFHLVSLQPRGEKGLLPIDGRATVIYAAAADGSLWEVSAHWYSDFDDTGWWFNAYPVTGPYGWDQGSRFLFRDSVPMTL